MYEPGVDAILLNNIILVCRMLVKNPLKPIFFGALLLLLQHTAFAQFPDLMRSIQNANENTQNEMSRELDELVRNAQSITTPSTAPVAAGVRLPSESADGKVILYTMRGCGYCTQALKHMRDKQIAHSERDIQANRSYAEEFKQLGGKGVPHILIGSTVLSGWDARTFEKRYTDWKATAAPAQAKSATNQPANSSKGAAPSLMPEDTSLKSGDVFLANLKGVRVVDQPSASAQTIRTLEKDERLTFMGEQRDGYVKVNSPKGKGWISKALVYKP